MATIVLYELSGKTGLLIRETADDALGRINWEELQANTPIEIDFSNVLAVSPSFMDQLLRGLRQTLLSDPAASISLSLHHVPTLASEKYNAVCRAHGLKLRETALGEWSITES